MRRPDDERLTMNPSTTRRPEHSGRAPGACALAGITGAARAQPPPPQTAPPEVASFLKDLRGHWQGKVTTTVGGQTTQSDFVTDCSAALGGVATQCVTKGPAADGGADSMEIYGYDFSLKQIRVAHVGADGTVGSAAGPLKANSADVRTRLVQDGKPGTLRYVVTRTGPNELRAHFIVKVGGTTVTDARSTQTRSP